MTEDAYYELRHASKEELLDAVVFFYRHSYKDDLYLQQVIERYLRIGFQLAQEDGWMQVAPAWLEDWRNRKDEHEQNQIML